MSKETPEWLQGLMKTISIPSGDVPNIELYMDQITTFMDSRLADSKRHPDDKIMTKTMINNYTKNHLLPPSVKKKYSREHIFLLIIIYRLKSMLSITDIQTLLEPLSEKYFPKNEENDLALKDIYDVLFDETEQWHEHIEQELLSSWESSRNSFSDYRLPEKDAAFLEDFTFLYHLCYDIYVRKQMIEKFIDYRWEQDAQGDKKNKKK